MRLAKKAKTVNSREECSVVFCTGKNFFDIKTGKNCFEKQTIGDHYRQWWAVVCIWTHIKNSFIICKHNHNFYFIVVLLLYFSKEIIVGGRGEVEDPNNKMWEKVN